MTYSDVRLHMFQAGTDHYNLPETSNPEYSYVDVPNITIRPNSDYSYAADSGANDEDQVIRFM